MSLESMAQHYKNSALAYIHTCLGSVGIISIVRFLIGILVLDVETALNGTTVDVYRISGTTLQKQYFSIDTYLPWLIGYYYDSEISHWVFSS